MSFREFLKVIGVQLYETVGMLTVYFLIML